MDIPVFFYFTTEGGIYVKHKKIAAGIAIVMMLSGCAGIGKKEDAQEAKTLEKKEEYTTKNGDVVKREDYIPDASKAEAKEMKIFIEKQKKFAENNDPVAREKKRTPNKEELSDEWLTGTWRSLDEYIFVNVKKEKDDTFLFTGDGWIHPQITFKPTKQSETEWQGTIGDFGSSSKKNQKKVTIVKATDNMFQVELVPGTISSFIRSSDEERDLPAESFLYEDNMKTGHFALQGDWQEEKLGLEFTFHPKDEKTGYIDAHEDGMAPYTITKEKNANEFTMEYEGKHGKQKADIKIKDKDGKKTIEFKLKNKKTLTMKKVIIKKEE